MVSPKVEPALPPQRQLVAASTTGWRRLRGRWHALGGTQARLGAAQC